MRERIEQAIEEILRPLVMADGGEISLVSVDPSVVVLRLGKVCTGCPGAPFTISRVIEPLLRTIVGPTVRIVVERDARTSTP